MGRIRRLDAAHSGPPPDEDLNRNGVSSEMRVMVARRRFRSRGVGVALLAVLGLGGCAWLSLPHAPGLTRPTWLGGAPEPAARWDFFATPRPGDPFTLPIATWRMRERAALRAGRLAPFPDLPPVSSAPAHPLPDAPAYPLPDAPAYPLPDARPRPAAPAAHGDFALAERYEAFLEEQRRELAPEVLRWVQTVASERYVDDGPIDRWPTLSELLHSVGDDCDGLELLSYHALRQLGFPPDRVYRAILENPKTRGHHMVTLWFEEPDDPWVLDPTDTISSRMRRLSQVSDWIPLKLFSEDAEFSVTRLAESDARPAPSPKPDPEE